MLNTADLNSFIFANYEFNITGFKETRKQIRELLVGIRRAKLHSSNRYLIVQLMRVVYIFIFTPRNSSFPLCLDLKNIHRILKRNQTKLRWVKERSAGGLERGGGR